MHGPPFDVAQPCVVLGQEAVDKVDAGAPQLLADAVHVELGLEGHRVTLDAGRAAGEGPTHRRHPTEGVASLQAGHRPGHRRTAPSARVEQLADVLAAYKGEE